MARRAITLTIVPHALFEALQFTLSPPRDPLARANRLLNATSQMPWKTLWMLVGSA